VSIEPDTVALAGDALIAVIADTRRAGHQDEPTILLRIGALDTRLAAARAVAQSGDATAAALLASQVIRTLASDFPGLAVPPRDLLEEQRAYRAIGTRLLSEAGAA
jgi:hypothetical protein